MINRIETILAVLFFAGMFGAIIIQVFFRYVLKNPLVWPYELSIYCFIYIVFFGAAIASRRNTHIVFGLMVDRMSVQAQLIVRIVTNLFVVAVLLLIFPSTISFIGFMGKIKSSSMGIPMYVVLVSFPLGMGLIVLYSILWAVRHFQEFMIMRNN
jgi:TRAP-type C4-dicarboxylate transport system permease small subunit